MLRPQEQLTKLWQETRSQMSTLPRKLRESVSNIVADKSENQVTMVDQKGKRIYYSLCPLIKRRMTITYCHICSRPVCGEHQISYV